MVASRSAQVVPARQQIQHQSTLENEGDKAAGPLVSVTADAQERDAEGEDASAAGELPGHAFPREHLPGLIPEPVHSEQDEREHKRKTWERQREDSIVEISQPGALAPSSLSQRISQHLAQPVSSRDMKPAVSNGSSTGSHSPPRRSFEAGQQTPPRRSFEAGSPPRRSFEAGSHTPPRRSSFEDHHDAGTESPTTDMSPECSPRMGATVSQARASRQHRMRPIISGESTGSPGSGVSHVSMKSPPLHNISAPASKDRDALGPRVSTNSNRTASKSSKGQKSTGLGGLASLPISRDMSNKASSEAADAPKQSQELSPVNSMGMALTSMSPTSFSRSVAPGDHMTSAATGGPDMSAVQSMHVQASVGSDYRRTKMSDIRNKLMRRVHTRDLSAEFDDEKTASPPTRSSLQSSLDDFIHTTLFELTISACIIINTIVMIFEDQYSGMEKGYKMQYPGMDTPAHKSWPHAEDAFLWLEWSFGIIFTLELLLKIIAYDIRFVKDAWNWLDTIIVAAFFVDRAASLALPISPTLLRLARLFRLLRVVKLTKSIQGFDRFYLMTSALRESVSAAFFGFLLLFLIQVVAALAIRSSLHSYLLDSAHPIEARHLVFQYYGSFTRALLTLFELTLANWPEPVRVLSEHVSEWWILVLILYVLCVGFAVVRVIMGVFTSVTFFVYDFDDQLLIQRQKRNSALHLQKMTALFEAADADGSGFLDLNEFQGIFEDANVQKWLGAMEFETSLFGNTADALFRLLDDGDGVLTAQELLEGVAKNKGAARSASLAVVMTECEEVNELILELKTGLRKLGSKQEERRRSARRLALPGAQADLAFFQHDSEGAHISTEHSAAERKIHRPWRTMNQKAVDNYSQVAAKIFVPMGSQEDSQMSLEEQTISRCAPVIAFAQSAHVEVFFILTLLIYAVVAVLDAQFEGMQVGYEIDYKGMTDRAEDVWPGARDVLPPMQVILGLAFVVELILNFVAHGLNMVRNGWYVIDILATSFWILEMLPIINMDLELSLVRLVRITRMSHLLVLVKLKSRFSKLQLIWTAVRGSVSALFWTIITFMLGLLIFGLTIAALLEGFYEDESRGVEERWEVFLFFGSFSKAMLTMFEMTLANWIPPSRKLYETASEWYMVYFLFHKISLGFCVVTVIAAVFLQETFNIAKNDNAVQHNMRSAAAKEHTKKMSRLFNYADKDGSGSVDLEEFRVIMRSPEVSTWLFAMGLDIQDSDAIFQMIDDGDGCLTAAELTEGLTHMKGPAKNIDMNMMHLEMKRLAAKLRELREQCTGIDVGELLGPMPPTAPK